VHSQKVNFATKLNQSGDISGMSYFHSAAAFPPLPILINRPRLHLAWGILQAVCPSCHPINSVEALKETHNTNSTVEWSDLILSSYTARLLTEVALLPFTLCPVPDMTLIETEL